ncbi:MAG: beta-L-arabinofuranosidase domain-containing protein [Lachnotalea sp.]
MQNETSSTKSLQLHLDFLEVSSTVIKDNSGNGYAAIIRNYDAGGAKLQEADIYGKQVKTILLPGGEDGGYIELPNGILENQEGITISFWCKVISSQDYHMLFSFGKDQLLYMKLLHEEGTNQISCIPCVSNSGQSQEQSIEPDVLLNIGRWYQMCVTLDSNMASQFSYYVDGQLVGQCVQNRISSIELGKAGNGFIGSKIFGANPIHAEFSDFKIFNRVLPQNEVQELFSITDLDCIKMDKEFLDSFMINPITQDLLLPLKGQYKSDFLYSSSREDIISSTGKVNRPLSSEVDVTVDMRVTIVHETEKKEYVYQLEVCALPSKKQIVVQDIKSLELPELHHIYRNIRFPDKGKLGSTITWKSSNPFILTAQGEVYRQNILDERKQVELTAIFNFEGVELTKTYQATVLSEYKRKQLEVILNSQLKTEIELKPVINAIQLSPGKVHLLEDNILTQNNKRNLDYLELLDADRMLYAFRDAFGVDTKNAKPLGGWDEPLGLLRGHSTGHFLSGLALAYGTTKYSVFKNKIVYMVDSLRDLQILSKGKPSEFKTQCTNLDAAQSKWSKNPSEWGEGYISAYAPDQFALLEQYTTYPTIWAPYYTLHKILAGLLDCYKYADNKTALIIACEIADWVHNRLSACTSSQLDKMWSLYIAGEYGGMNESLSQLYLITKISRYLEAAKFFDNDKVFHGLADNRDTIATLHANQHIPQIIGALKEYEATGELHYYETAYYFWDIVTKHYTYSIGGLGRGENFKEPDILAAHIDTDKNCETCAAYNMLKLTNMLYYYNPEKGEYMDYYEKTFFNHIIASQNPVVTNSMHHGVTYMLPIGQGQHKEYGSDYHEFTCCHGTGMENHVKYHESIYYKNMDLEILYINLYIPSKIDWKQSGMELIQEGDFPSEKMRITVNRFDNFTFCFRIPNWCQDEFRVLLNGEEIAKQDNANHYIAMTKNWNKTDNLEICMPYHISLEYTPDCLDLPVASVLYGPLVMVAVSNSLDWITLTLSPNLENEFIVVWEKEMPVIYYDELRFIPMYAAHHIDYHTYFKIIIPYVD